MEFGKNIKFKFKSYYCSIMYLLCCCWNFMQPGVPWQLLSCTPVWKPLRQQNYRRNSFWGFWPAYLQIIPSMESIFCVCWSRQYSLHITQGLACCTSLEGFLFSPFFCSFFWRGGGGSDWTQQRTLCQGKPKTINLNCSRCSHEKDLTFTFDIFQGNDDGDKTRCTQCVHHVV